MSRARIRRHAAPPAPASGRGCRSSARTRPARRRTAPSREPRGSSSTATRRWRPGSGGRTRPTRPRARARSSPARSRRHAARSRRAGAASRPSPAATPKYCSSARLTYWQRSARSMYATGRRHAVHDCAELALARRQRVLRDLEVRDVVQHDVDALDRAVDPVIGHHPAADPARPARCIDEGALVAHRLAGERAILVRRLLRPWPRGRSPPTSSCR